MNAPVAMQSEYNFPAVPEPELIQTLRNSFYPGATDASIKMVISYCRAAQLNPMLKPVHLVPMRVKKVGGGRDDYEWRDVVMPGVNHYRTQAHRSGEYAGKTEPEFGPEKSTTLGNVKVTFPEWCKITVYREKNGIARAFTAKEYWIENYATAGKDSDAPNAMWKKRPIGQLAKVAEAQALRMAFPELTGGTNTAEEMEGKTLEDATDMVTVASSAPQAALTKPKAEQQLNTFANASKPKETVAATKTAAPAAQTANGQPITDIDPETGEVLDPEAADYPNIPADALNDWEMEGKWLRGYKWFAMQLPEVFPPSRKAFIERHRPMLEATAKHAKYGPELSSLLEANGAKL
jgi:phage recombination protein Bet